MKNYELRIRNYKPHFRLFLFFLLPFSFCLLTNAQSTSIEYPTAVSTNEISGKIAARDLGDARLTAFYYKFEGTQGDIFINVSAANFNGDVDVYAADGLRPLTKITFYGDNSMTETGRVIYLRKPEKLILRVEGRTPDDNPAIFKIKFAGSFVAVADTGESEQPKLPEITAKETSGIRVNSVGTIIAVKPKPTPVAVKTVAENETTTGNETSSKTTPEVIVTENLETAKSGELKVGNAEGKIEKATTKRPARRNTTARNSRNNARKSTASKTKATPETTASKPDPLENVRLIVLMKDGETLEFPMTQVFRFTMNNGVLTIITKDGKIHRRSILEVQKMTVE